MKFGAPEFLIWLLLILPMAGVLWWLHRQRAARLGRLVVSDVWKTVIPGRSRRGTGWRTVLRLTALFCIGLALTRPQWGSHWEEVNQRGLDIIVVLDTSKSMLAEDLKPNRLQQAKWAVRDFVKQLKGDRIGLVAFAGSSFLQCPVTVDYAAFTMMLDDLYAGIIPRGGTAIGQALETARESFDGESDADRVIILITDGEDHEGDAEEMAEQLREEKIKLFAVGVGTADGELIPTDSGYVKDAQGRVVKTSLNESLLEKLASSTGGFYVRSAPGDFGLDRIYKLGISSLQRGEQETRLARVYEERFGWFAGAALLFLLAEGLISAPKAAALLLALFWMSAPRAEAAAWYDFYKEGNYTNALEELKQPDEKNPDLAAYNRGVLLYRMNQFQESEEAFAEAAAQTEQPQLKQKALYNRGTALLRNARIALNDPEKMENGFDLAAQALRQFEDVLLLNPDDVHARKNWERTLNLITGRRVGGAQGLMDAGDGLLEEFKAKEAKENYETAKTILTPVVENFDPGNQTAEELIERADGQLDMLARAVEETRLDMEDAKRFIDDYFYKEAADIMLDDKKERKWAFSLDEELAQEFHQLIENNMNVINIIYPNNPLKP